MRRLLFCVFLTTAVCAAESADVALDESEGRIDISIGGKNVATYIYNDPQILRPYFCQVKTLDGSQVTRIHPPDPAVNKDNDDHETMHPGLWLAFGDLSGHDFWRNKGRVRHVRFEGAATPGPVGRFVAVNSYEPEADETVCEETCTYTIRAVKHGWILTSSSEFRSARADFAFNDQEEMGFGARLNTPLTVKFGDNPTLINSDNAQNEKGTWGRQAEWCLAGGVVEGRRVGLMLMPDPANFRPSWFHSRDYGLIVANPFGKKSMSAPDDKAVAPDSTVVRKGETFKIGFGVYVFGSDANETIGLARQDEKSSRRASGPPDDTLYGTYLQILQEETP